MALYLVTRIKKIRVEVNLHYPDCCCCTCAINFSSFFSYRRAALRWLLHHPLTLWIYNIPIYVPPFFYIYTWKSLDYCKYLLDVARFYADAGVAGCTFSSFLSSGNAYIYIYTHSIRDSGKTRERLGVTSSSLDCLYRSRRASDTNIYRF